MRDRRMRLALAAAAAGAIAIGTAFAAGSSGREASRVAPTKAGGEMPAALDRHLTELSKTIPGNGGEPGESSGLGSESSSAMQDFIELAYPKKDIPLSSIKAARKAIAAAEARSPGHRSGVWRQVGPQTAIYPFTPLRTAADYVPNEYAAGGRTTDLAIDPNCGLPGAHCRMWITPAGGGVWRTKNALLPKPKWEYLSGSFGINSIGSITIDPNDPSGDTLWVGTGEGNTCGSGCVAGVGLYKSTDGGDHWTGPIGTSAFNARGVGTIAIKPGSPNTILAGLDVRRARPRRVVLLRRGQPVPGADPGCADLGPLPLHERRRDVDARPQRLDRPGRVRKRRARDREQHDAVLAARVRRVLFDPSNANIVYAASYARGVWRSSDSGSTWTQIKPSLNSAIATTRPDIAVTRLDERQHAHVRRRGPHGQLRRPSTAGSPAATTWRPARRSSRSSRATTRQRRPGTRTTSARASAGTTTSSTRRRAIRTCCTPEARTCTARTSRTTAASALDERGHDVQRRDATTAPTWCTRTGSIPTSTGS